MVTIDNSKKKKPKVKTKIKDTCHNQNFINTANVTIEYGMHADDIRMSQFAEYTQFSWQKLKKSLISQNRVNISQLEKTTVYTLSRMFVSSRMRSITVY